MTAALREITFPSNGIPCGAWHLSASNAALADANGRPCVVMGHGFGVTRDSALLPYAEPFAAAGFDVLLFDYRGFGTSGGSPRQRVAVQDRRIAAIVSMTPSTTAPGNARQWPTSSSSSAGRRPSPAAPPPKGRSRDGYLQLLLQPFLPG